MIFERTVAAASDFKNCTMVNCGTCNYLVAVRRDLLFRLMLRVGCVISSPEPSGSQVELIVYPSSSSLALSTISNIFFSEATWPIKAKFYVEPPWEVATKVYINGPGHMAKITTMPIHGKNL